MRSSPSAMPPCGGVPYSSASRKKPKRDVGFFVRHAQRSKDFALNVLAMNTDRARSQLGAVEHDVVGQRANFAKRRLGIGDRVETVLELGHVFFMRRSEGMVRRVPALALAIPFKHREIGDPEKPEIFRRVASLLECVVLRRRISARGRAGEIHTSRRSVEGFAPLTRRSPVYRALPASSHRSSGFDLRKLRTRSEISG